MYILKYSDRAEYKPNVGLWVGVDQSSGGYPHATKRCDQAHVFLTLKDAKEYVGHFKDLDIFTLEVKTTPIEDGQNTYVHPKSVFVVVRPGDSYSAYADGVFQKRSDAEECLQHLKDNGEGNALRAWIAELELE